LKRRIQEFISKSEAIRHTILELKKQVEEAQVIREALTNKLQDKDRINEELEAEIVSARMKLQKKDIHQDSSKILDEIINRQKSYFDKTGLGYNANTYDKGSCSKREELEDKHKSYVEAVKLHKEEKHNPQNQSAKGLWK
jgi:DNA repair exonuclease SbcCD ATPase subunit